MPMTVKNQNLRRK